MDAAALFVLKTERFTPWLRLTGPGAKGIIIRAGRTWTFNNRVKIGAAVKGSK